MKTSVAVLVLALVVCVFGHGGLVEPAPLGDYVCSASSDSSYCGVGTTPCGPGNGLIGDPTPIGSVEAGEEVDISFWQRNGHNVGVNTYEIVLLETDEDGNTMSTSLKSLNQPDVANNVWYNTTVQIPQDADKGIALIQFIFNATNSNAGVYYTCSAVEITKTSSATTIFYSLVLLLVAVVFAF